VSTNHEARVPAGLQSGHSLIGRNARLLSAAPRWSAVGRAPLELPPVHSSGEVLDPIFWSPKLEQNVSRGGGGVWGRSREPHRIFGSPKGGGSRAGQCTDRVLLLRDKRHAQHGKAERKACFVRCIPQSDCSGGSASGPALRVSRIAYRGAGCYTDLLTATTAADDLNPRTVFLVRLARHAKSWEVQLPRSQSIWIQCVSLLHGPAPACRCSQPYP